MRAAAIVGRFAFGLVRDIAMVIALAVCLVLASFDDDARPY